MSASSELPPLPTGFARADLEAAGFTGWRTWSELRTSAFAEVPCTPGVYVVFRASLEPPAFVHPSPAGWYQGMNPSVDTERLRREWVPSASTVYIGKADFRKRRRPVEALRRRLEEYSRFGAGEDIAHRGGRLIWQLADSADLLVAWRQVTWAQTARAYEKRLLARFEALHDGRRPFANLTG